MCLLVFYFNILISLLSLFYYDIKIILGVTEIPAGCYSVPQSRPGSRQSCNSTESETLPMEPEVAKALQEELTSTDGWQDSISLDDR